MATIVMTCHACGESCAYEYGTGDRSGLCWRETCKARRRLRPMYDYARQCWIIDGKVAQCGHLTPTRACYSCAHVGETVE